MQRNRVVIASALMAMVLTGCIALFTAKVPPHAARGTWTGVIDPIALTGEEGAERVIGIQFKVSEGPPLLQAGVADPPIPVPTEGFYTVLADHRREVLPWQYPTPDRRPAEVAGYWNANNSHARLKGKPVVQADMPRQWNHRYNVILVDRLEVEEPAPATQPAATQPAGFELTAKRVSEDQIDLSWTAWKGAAEYRVELSLDGVDFFESIEVDANDTKASLVGFDEATAGQSYHIRVVAMDDRERVLARSNVRIIKR